MDDLNRNLSSLSPQKLQLLESLLRDEGSRFNAFPLTYGQERLWFMEQLHPNSSLYNIDAAVALEGHLNKSALAHSLDQIVRRHDVLRSRFVCLEGNPLQVIDDDAPLTLSFDDLSELHADDLHPELNLRLCQNATEAFDLSSGPLLRASLIKLSNTEHILQLVLHHIIADGWSLTVLLNELCELYSAYGTDRPGLPDLQIQYTDYARWQREQMGTELMEKQLEYWREQLADAPNLLELPGARLRPAHQSYRGAVHRLQLNTEMTTALKAISRQEGVTLFILLLAAFKVLLSRYTERHDIVVGTVVAGRQQREVEDLIGLFVNTLALRTDLRGASTLRDVLSRVRHVLLEAHAHQDAPFEKVVEALQPDRALTHSPLVQIMFVMQSGLVRETDFGGLTLRRLELQRDTAKFDLTLVLEEVADSLDGWIEYNYELYDHATIERLVQHYLRVLEAAIHDVQSNIGDIDLLSNAERRQVLVDWNQTAVPYPNHAGVVELFEEQALARGEAIAVIDDTGRLTYHELNEQANRLAWHLRSAGVGPDVLVGVRLKRSKQMVVALLAVLKSGGAYVPLDTRYPPERLAYMMNDARLNVVISDKQSAQSVRASGARVIVLDDERDAIKRESAANPGVRVCPENLAYVIYTSGSTGHPKGVCISHRGIVRLVKGPNYASLTADEVFLQLAPISFDASTLEVWGCLLNGGRLVMMPADTPSIDDIAEAIQKYDVTILWLTSGLFHLMVNERIDALKPLRQLLAGGDVLSPGHVKRALEQLPGCRVINGYGPTENTTFTCCHPMTDPSQVRGSVSIGRPISNTRVYIVDPHFRPVPIGVSGELCIGGDGLARGYLNAPDLTAEKFVPNLFSEEPGARLYKSGDLCRHRADGTIEFIGRTDYQVKVRGFRIEPAEIEAVLDAHPSVGGSLVLAREDSPDDKRLVAYIVPEKGWVANGGELRNYLKEKLPDHMVPSAVVVMEAFPLTANGKIDRRALPAPDKTRDEQAALFVAPRTPVEEILAAIWSEVLGVDRVGVDDGFFDLGGHSLLAARMISRLREAFKVDLPLRALFESSTIALLARTVEELKRAGKGLQVPPIQASKTSGDIPLTYGQERLWFMEQLHPHSSLYNIDAAVALEGDLNKSALAHSLDQIVRRHDVLRSRFVCLEGNPLQVIDDDAPLALSFDDLSELHPDDLPLELHRRLRRNAIEAFDLSSGPLLRASLIKLSNTEHVLQLVLHHIIADGWSLTVLLNELCELYSAYGTDRPGLPDLQIQYTDYARWQREQMGTELMEKQLEYWREQLADAPNLLELPGARLRPAHQSYRGGVQRVELSAQITAAVKAMSRREGMTVYMVLLAAFKVLLWRYTERDDIVVGTVVAGRQQREVEKLIGLFVNTLALRTDLRDARSFRDVLRRVREVMLEAHAHQDAPFEKVVEALQPERALSHTPMVQVMFVMQSGLVREGELGDGVMLRRLEVERETAKFDLTLVLEEGADVLQGWMEYSSELYDAATITRLIGHYIGLLEAVTADAELNIGEIEFLSKAEREQLLNEWNETGVAYPNQSSVVELFEEQALARGEAIAVIDDTGRLTYRELNEQANRLASHLRSAGVDPDVLVGVCLKRSKQMVVALLAVLKSGGAYVPLDTRYPPERLAYMVNDARLKVVISDQQSAQSVSASGAKVIVPDDERDAIKRESAANPGVRVRPENLAYVIYTSGSTGHPKGVCISHRGLSNLICWHRRVFRVSSEDRAPQLAGVAFDASVWELWPYLTIGACICMPDDETRLSPERLRDWLIANRITIAFAPTPLAEPMISLEWPKDTPLRCMLTGGDRLHHHPPDLLPFELINNYGPSENTVVATYITVPANPLADGTPPIGRPIDNVQVYVLDRKLRPAPVGIAGELCIGGEGLARGYLNSPDITAEKFIPNPFSRQAGLRLYRTGDQACFLPDGSIRFIGRLDHQVKLRGYRMELGEIEAVLKQHASVNDVVVMVSENEGENRLVGYLVPEPGAELRIEDVKQWARGKLPEYMVPVWYVEMERLPLTRNGKVDRRALPPPQYLADRSPGSYAAPRTPIEQILAEMWAKLLNVSAVGLHDNFFELGGHSLLATQSISRIREVFQLDIPLRSLFECPRVIDMAALIEAARQTGDRPRIPAIERAPRDGELFLSSAQQRLWFLEQLSPGNSAYNIPLALRIRGPLDVTALERTLNEIVRRHEVLRTTFAAADGRPVLVIAPTLKIGISITDAGELDVEEREPAIERRLRESAREAFDLTTGPLVRASLIKLTGTEHVLQLVLHHIIADGWSLTVLMNELRELYSACASGGLELAELKIQYADFARWQHEQMRTQVMQSQLEYWRAQLAGAPNVLELPGARPRPTQQSYRGAIQRLELNSEMSAALRAMSRQEGVTPFMVLLAAFKVLLSRYTGQHDIVVGTDIANRNRVEVEGLIGFFANQLVLRTDLSGNPTFKELLKRVREVTLGAYANQDLPFEKLVEELQPQRDLSHNPLFQVMVIFQNAPMPALELAGLTLEVLEIEEETSVFDLSMAFIENERGGIVASLRYNTDLFERAEAARILTQFETLLRGAIEKPETRIDSLEILTQVEANQKSMKEIERKKNKFDKLLSVKPKTIRVSERRLVTTGYLESGQLLPLVIRPEVEDLDLAAWAKRDKAFIEEQLRIHGAILFRDFKVESISQFEQFTRAIASDLIEYGERSSPRTKLTGGVYTSTDHPADQYIRLHNEQSYTLNWPMKIWFFCVQPAGRGGNTPIADSRRILNRLDGKIVDCFLRRQVMYMRNYGDGLGLTWQEVFQTTDKSVVEEHCRGNSIEVEWKDNNRLRTRQIRPAIRRHPRTNELVWFNHALFFHVSSLEPAARQSLSTGIAEQDLPFNTYYGDGLPIESSVLEEIREAYRQETLSFPWQHGDALMLDNMLAAHGREPFEGPRRIVVAMAELFNSTESEFFQTD